MKTVLWFSDHYFSDKSIITGGWVQSLAEILQASNQVNIVGVTTGTSSQGNIKKSIYKGIVQYQIPLQKDPNKYIKSIISIVEDCKPDIIHVWGTERIWLYLLVQCKLNVPLLLDIQGLLFTCYYHFLGGLSMTEVIKSIHLKEILLPWRSLWGKKKTLKKRGIKEIEALKNIKHISVQSEWVKNQIWSLKNSDTFFYYTKITLRQEFYQATPWSYHNRKSNPIIYSSCNAATSFKGLHILIKALSILKKIYPGIQLRLAGTIDVGNRILDGYSIYLRRLAKDLDVNKNIEYIGRLNANEVIKELQQSDVCVIPSFVETYCLGFAEAMMIGVPCVASYAGAMPELAEHKKEALFYNPTDINTCAAFIDCIIQNAHLASFLSENARKRRLKENSTDQIVRTQLSIYERVLYNHGIN